MEKDPKKGLVDLAELPPRPSGGSCESQSVKKMHIDKAAVKMNSFVRELYKNYQNALFTFGLMSLSLCLLSIFS